MTKHGNVIKFKIENNKGDIIRYLNVRAFDGRLTYSRPIEHIMDIDNNLINCFNSSNEYLAEIILHGKDSFNKIEDFFDKYKKEKIDIVFPENIVAKNAKIVETSSYPYIDRKRYEFVIIFSGIECERTEKFSNNYFINHIKNIDDDDTIKKIDTNDTSIFEYSEDEINSQNYEMEIDDIFKETGIHK